MDNQTREPVPYSDEQKISRTMMAWINTYPNLPTEIVNFNQLKADAVGMALEPIQTGYILTRYIYGGYQAEYQFKLIYRIKPGMSNDVRLKADELLNAIGDWARANKPTLGANIRVVKLEATTRGELLYPYENGDEDRQILMRMIYEVI